jgi:hypothetical protein
MDRTTINKISDLKTKIVKKTATQQEIDEYVDIFHDSGKLSDDLYKKYKRKQFVDDIVSTCVILGGIIIAGLLIREAINQ